MMCAANYITAQEQGTTVDAESTVHGSGEVDHSKPNVQRMRKQKKR